MNRNAIRFAAISLVLAPATAWAHPEHGARGFAEGLAHPVTGLDHLAAMLLVGVVARLVAGRPGWLVPAVFVGGLAAGFVSGTSVPVFWVEAVIILSLLAFGAAAALRRAMPVAPAVLATGIFGFAHGAAHGIEMPGNAAPLLFAAGFLASSALLHGAGYWLSRNLTFPARRFGGALPATDRVMERAGIGDSGT